MINTNATIDGICKTLAAGFGEEYHIYVDDVVQNLKEPCFIVTCLSPENTRFLGNRFFQNGVYIIQYFPKPLENEQQEDCYSMAHKLYRQLEFIEVGGALIRYLRPNAQIVDGVLTFTAVYNNYSYEAELNPKMEDLEHKFLLKG